MLKKWILGLLCLLSVGTSVAWAATPDTPKMLVINGQNQPGTVMLMDGGQVYVPVRETSMQLGALAVRWTGREKTATVVCGSFAITATEGQEYIVASGRVLYAPGGCRVYKNKLYVPAQQPCKALGADYRYSRRTGIVTITSGDSDLPLESGETYYKENDLYWLSRIIDAEARGESLMGKIAVGNVVLNRVASPSFPDTVKGVIFDKRCGIQFSPAYSGSIYRTPVSDSVIAAKIALEGEKVAGDSLFFSPGKNSWAERNREYVTTIGGHKFFA